ncbi:lamin tail domain-containing protein, partial [Candidatus Bipolaricaulota bacterium]|nr:lamin tail domain-containing protein [Candidatus Bipolaricaulota bacterium]
MNRVERIAVLVAVGLLIQGAVCFGSDLVISEIAWAGTASNSYDEWIELRNSGEDAVDLAGWQLAFGDTLIPLGEAGEDTLDVRTTVLEPGAFLILERTDDSTISDITADVLYKGLLPNTGILMELRNPEGVVVDSVAPGEETGWPSGSPGDGDPAYCTMERTSLGEWTSNNTIVRNGLDADENPVNGTPGQPNSTEVLAQWAPIVDLTFPAEEGSILTGVEVLTWVASDPNGTAPAL